MNVTREQMLATALRGVLMDVEDGDLEYVTTVARCARELLEACHERAWVLFQESGGVSIHRL